MNARKTVLVLEIVHLIVDARAVVNLYIYTHAHTQEREREKKVVSVVFNLEKKSKKNLKKSLLQVRKDEGKKGGKLYRSLFLLRFEYEKERTKESVERTLSSVSFTRVVVVVVIYVVPMIETEIKHHSKKNISYTMR